MLLRVSNFDIINEQMKQIKLLLSQEKPNEESVDLLHKNLILTWHEIRQESDREMQEKLAMASSGKMSWSVYLQDRQKTDMELLKAREQAKLLSIDLADSTTLPDSNDTKVAEVSTKMEVRKELLESRLTEINFEIEKICGHLLETLKQELSIHKNDQIFTKKELQAIQIQIVEKELLMEKIHKNMTSSMTLSEEEKTVYTRVIEDYSQLHLMVLGQSIQNVEIEGWKAREDASKLILCLNSVKLLLLEKQEVYHKRNLLLTKLGQSTSRVTNLLKGMDKLITESESLFPTLSEQAYVILELEKLGVKKAVLPIVSEVLDVEPVIEISLPEETDMNYSMTNDMELVEVGVIEFDWLETKEVVMDSTNSRRSRTDYSKVSVPSGFFEPKRTLKELLETGKDSTVKKIQQLNRNSILRAIGYLFDLELLGKRKLNSKSNKDRTDMLGTLTQMHTVLQPILNPEPSVKNLVKTANRI